MLSRGGGYDCETLVMTSVINYPLIHDQRSGLSTAYFFLLIKPESHYICMFLQNKMSEICAYILNTFLDEALSCLTRTNRWQVVFDGVKKERKRAQVKVAYAASTLTANIL